MTIIGDEAGQQSRLTETLADVAARLQRASWDVMDEEQRDEVMANVVVPRWGMVTADGFTLKATKWADLLGTTEQTIRGRFRRLNSRSEGDSDRPTSGLTEAQKADRRAARQLLRNPDTAAELLSDPDVQAAVEDVIAADPEAVTRVVEQRRSMGLPPGGRPGGGSDDVPLSERWLKWLNQLNSVLLQGARLADQTNPDELTGYAAMSYALYLRFSETQISAETKNLDEELRTLLRDAR